MLDTAKNVLDVLVELGKLQPNQAVELRTKQVTSDASLEKVVLDSGLVKAQDMLEALSALNNIPIANLSQVGASPEAMAVIDETLAARYGMFPFAIDETTNRILIAMKNPLDLTAISFVEQKSGKRVAAHYGDPDEIDRAISVNYSSDLTTDVSQALEDSDNTVSGNSISDFSALASDGIIKQAP
ncbi:MAG: hypothetical protein LBG64_01065, partial [Pseudomonadales bacterium]|nr:hypothetical protein [Pseudomonadales bacterium]